jgi:hypothetical protein
MTYRLIDKTSEITGQGNTTIRSGVDASVLLAVLTDLIKHEYHGAAVNARISGDGRSIIGEIGASMPDEDETITLVRAEIE